MKRQDLVQIKGLDLKELRIKVRTLREEIAGLILDKNMKKLKDLKMVSKKKRDLAQVLTVIRQKELLEQLESISRQSSDVSHQTKEELGKKQEKPKKGKSLKADN